VLGSEEGPIRLVMAGARAGASRLAETLEGAGDIDVHARARARRLRRLGREALSLRTTDTAVERGFDWVRLRLLDHAPDLARRRHPDGLADAPAADPGTAVRACCALAALALGEPTSAEGLLAAMASRLDGAGDDAATRSDTSLFLLLAASHARWIGDAGTFAALLPAARHAAVRLLATRPATGLASAALAEIGRVAEAAAPAFAAEIAAALAGGSPDVDGARSAGPAGPRPAALARLDGLPAAAAGGAGSAVWSALLDFLSRHGDVVGPAPLVGPAAPAGAEKPGAGWNTAASAWRSLLEGSQSAGERAWTGAVLSGIEHGNALWDHDLSLPPALLALGLVHGLLGAAPDATRHRLRLRPYATRSWTTWSVNELRVGDARVDVSFVRTADGVTVAADQTAGAFPLQLVLELVLSETRVGAVAVDGRAATLDVRRHGAGLLVPVQLVLDDRRVLTIAYDRGGTRP
jgi:hypothetical protein